VHVCTCDEYSTHFIVVTCYWKYVLIMLYSECVVIDQFLYIAHHFPGKFAFAICWCIMMVEWFICVCYLHTEPHCFFIHYQTRWKWMPVYICWLSSTSIQWSSLLLSLLLNECFTEHFQTWLENTLVVQIKQLVQCMSLCVFWQVLINEIVSVLDILQLVNLDIISIKFKDQDQL